MERLYWQLDYADGSHQQEPDTGASIRLSSPNAVLLQIVTADGMIIARVRLVVDGVVFQPIFYRIKQMVMDGHAQPNTEATVFGRARESGNQIDAMLLAGVNGHLIDCPEEYLDQPMVAIQCELRIGDPVAFAPAPPPVS